MQVLNILLFRSCSSSGLDPTVNIVQKEIVIFGSMNDLGFVLRSDNPPSISYVEDGSRASRKGLKIGDRILGVNGQDVTKIPYQDVVEIIRNSPHAVELEIARLEEIFVHPLTSEEEEHYGEW